MRLPVAAAALVALASCTGLVPPGGQPVAASVPRQATPPFRVSQPPATAPAPVLAVQAVAGPSTASLPIDEAQAARARTAFVATCPALLSRVDRTGLTRPGDWRDACAAARGGGDALGFFAARFETVRIGDGQAFATGYYEPEIAGSLSRDDRHRVPIYGRPTDLIDIDLGLFQTALAGKRVGGRMAGGKLVPYHDRGAIEAGALGERAAVIAWAADPVDLFVTQIQGSGRLRLPDGRIARIGYAGSNGRDYVGVGKLMRERGLLGAGQTSMQGIAAWLRANPAQAPAIMNANKSYVFFRLLTGPGALGALGVSVTPRVSVAADPAFVPLGAPVWLELDRPEARAGLWVAQDTGGAIKGANRFDTFWGTGDEAYRIAGGMSARGTALVLVPRGTLARLRDARP